MKGSKQMDSDDKVVLGFVGATALVVVFFCILMTSLVMKCSPGQERCFDACFESEANHPPAQCRQACK